MVGRFVDQLSGTRIFLGPFGWCADRHPSKLIVCPPLPARWVSVEYSLSPHWNLKERDYAFLPSEARYPGVCRAGQRLSRDSTGFFPGEETGVTRRPRTNEPAHPGDTADREGAALRRHRLGFRHS